MKMKLTIWLSTALFLTAMPVHAQQSKKVPRIGFLCGPSAATISARIEALRRGLRELGYVEGHSLEIEYRYADGKFDRLPELAADLVRRKVDVIIAGGGLESFRAAKNATNTIPVVMTAAIDPVSNGLVASLAQPGGNVTGLSLGGNELYGKRLEILKETVPRISRVAFFWSRLGQVEPSFLHDIRVSAQSLGLRVQPIEVVDPSDFENAFRKAAKDSPNALTVSIDPIFIGNRRIILDFAAKKRLAAIYYAPEWVEDGGLMSYAPQFADLWRRTAGYVDKILKGRKPAELPVEQPMKFEFIVNLKTAKQIGVTVPPNVLVRADRVIR